MNVKKHRKMGRGESGEVGKKEERSKNGRMDKRRETWRRKIIGERRASRDKKFG